MSEQAFFVEKEDLEYERKEATRWLISENSEDIGEDDVGEI